MRRLSLILLSMACGVSIATAAAYFLHPTLPDTLARFSLCVTGTAICLVLMIQLKRKEVMLLTKHN